MEIFNLKKIDGCLVIDETLIRQIKQYFEQTNQTLTIQFIQRRFKIGYYEAQKIFNEIKSMQVQADNK